jgi:hypothetical protein
VSRCWLEDVGRGILVDSVLGRADSIAAIELPKTDEMVRL